ncbi:hypothetical protein Tco_1519971 [Tanacetum coccineum]
MSTQQDIYVAGSENHPPMLNKDNYVPWSSCILHYAKSKPNAESTHEQTDDELTDKEVKQMEVDDQEIQTILMGLPKDIYATIDNCETTKEIWLCVEHMLKGSSIGARRRLEKIASNLKFLSNLQPEWKRYVTTVHQTSDLYEVDYTQLYDFLKFNQAEDGYNAVQNVRNQVVQNLVQNSSNQNVGNQNGLIVVLGIANQNANQNGNGNVVAARAEGNGNGNNGNKIRWYNYRGLSYYARNYTTSPRRKDLAYLQTQLLIAQKEEA